MPLRKNALSLLKRALGRDHADARPAARPPAPPVEPTPQAAPPERPRQPPLEVDAPLPGSLLLDIREPGELSSGAAQDALLLPMDCVPHQVDLLDRARPITVYCAAGARSLGVAHWLREQGFSAVSLEGGIQSLRWADPPWPLRQPDRAGERVVLGPSATIDGVPVGEGVAERVDGDRLRVIDATGLQLVGRLG